MSARSDAPASRPPGKNRRENVRKFLAPDKIDPSESGTASSRATVSINGRTLTLSNLEKVFYPKAGFTKSQVIDYYARVARVLLPHLRDRPLTLKRYPDGVEGFHFYEKRCPVFRPDWLQTAPIWSERNNEHISFCLANDLPSLIWAANLADLELHTALFRYQHPDRPTVLVFDLDPGPGVDVIDCAEVALWLRDYLQQFQMECFAKTSGSKGLQVYAPLNTTVTFEQTKAFARQAAEHLTAEHPERVIQRMEKKLRGGKVFIDWSQNDAHKT
ncbi:MAG TPA: non-homologous end-joining DNA ligase, partial [Chthoniobacteraceae bacterium]|nr:non-homologous end-joining DNA ligase [Chthoniobacteraceae bacterium]